MARHLRRHSGADGDRVGAAIEDSVQSVRLQAISKGETNIENIPTEASHQHAALYHATALKVSDTIEQAYRILNALKRFGTPSTLRLD